MCGKLGREEGKSFILCLFVVNDGDDEHHQDAVDDILEELFECI